METLASLLVYAILCSSLYYLGSRAVITQALWSRYPKGLAKFMDCPACTGFWYGLLLRTGLSSALWGRVFTDTWLDGPLVGLAMIALVPMVAGLLNLGFNANGTTVDDGP